ncbi:MAG: hypothetical protein NTZ95_06060 [Candidatus Omnitrophica bacterium]|nr:hypothetical protein [Candidatus Omnitrophota bacterium]
MSIIQEALKKIEKPEESYEEKRQDKPVFTPDIKKPSPDREAIGPKYVYYVITAVLLIILAGIVIRISYSSPSSVPVPEPKKTEFILPKIERREESSSPARRRENIGGFVLNGIMYLVDGPRAIINDIIVGEGEMVSGAKVEKIKKDSVILNYKNSEVALNINK